jgi:hypothetical protein
LNKLAMLEQEILLEEIIDHWMKGYQEEYEQIDDILLVGVEF